MRRSRATSARSLARLCLVSSAQLRLDTPASEYPRLKRQALTSFRSLKKRQKQSKDLGANALPDGLAGQLQGGYSALEHMSETPMGRTVLKSLRKKGTDLKFMCAEVCGAAVEEGSKFFQTRSLANVSRESKFHHRLVKDLPKVDAIKLPIQHRKKLRYKYFSSLATSYVRV